MNELKNLLSLLLYHRHTIHVLHWNAVDAEFDDYHKDITSEYYDKLLSDADVVAEFCKRLDIPVVSFQEVATAGFTPLVDVNKSYGKEDIQKILDTIFGQILSGIEAVHDTEIINTTSNMGIKAQLESMHNEYDLQKRYINKKRMATPDADAMEAVITYFDSMILED